MSYVFPIPPVASLPIEGSNNLFPVRRVYCVGRNYAAHTREMGFDPDREPPFFFCKPNDKESVVVCPAGQLTDIPYPDQTNNYHYEAELIVAIGKGGKNISVTDALDHIYGYATGLDMTRRDLQMKMREQGRPWEIGKAFDFSAPVGPIKTVNDAGKKNRGGIRLELDGKVVQQSDLKNLIWSVDEIVSNLSSYFELRPGDLIFTGTPEGVGPVKPGQTLVAGIEGLTPIAIRIGQRAI